MWRNEFDYQVRISTKKNPKFDFDIFINDIKIKNEASWDKDKSNKIKIGDYIGFIIGENGKEIVNIFKVKDETKRETHWKHDEPYVLNNGTHSVKHRDGIILTNIHETIKTIEWVVLKKSINFANGNKSWMPRGM